MFLNERCKAVTFPRKNELPQVGLEPTTLYTLPTELPSMYSYKCMISRDISTG